MSAPPAVGHRFANVFVNIGALAFRRVRCFAVNVSEEGSIDAETNSPHRFGGGGPHRDGRLRGRPRRYPGPPITHNTVDAYNPTDQPDATSAIISNHGSDTNILIEANLLAGGGHTVYFDQNSTG